MKAWVATVLPSILRNRYTSESKLFLVFCSLISLRLIPVFPKFGNEVFCLLIEPFHRFGYILQQASRKTFGD